MLNAEQRIPKLPQIIPTAPMLLPAFSFLRTPRKAKARQSSPNIRQPTLVEISLPKVYHDSVSKTYSIESVSDVMPMRKVIIPIAIDVMLKAKPAIDFSGLGGCGATWG